MPRYSFNARPVKLQVQQIIIFEVFTVTVGLANVSVRNKPDTPSLCRNEAVATICVPLSIAIITVNEIPI